jgi:tripartite-type tricarboxylate transporter receptor subunit TctC
MGGVHPFCGTSAGLALILAGALACAQPFPVKPVRIISPFAPGGGTDFIARLLAPRLTQSLGQQVIVENRPGAGGTVGTEAGVRAAPDGYTLVVVSAGYCVNPYFHKVKFDPVDDISPIVQVAKGPLVISAHPSLPVTTIKGLIALAKARPDELNYSTSGTGSMGHMAGELLSYVARIRLTHIPYKGTGPALSDAIAGHTHLNVSGISTVLPHVKSGRLKALAVTSARRVPEAPSIPTVAESGVAGYEVTSWQGLIAPKNVPRAIVEKINADVVDALHQNDVEHVLRSNGVAPVGNTPEQFAAEMRRELALWRKVLPGTSTSR